MHWKANSTLNMLIWFLLNGDWNRINTRPKGRWGGGGGGRLRALSEFALEKGTQKFSLFFLLFPLSSSYHLPPHFKNKIYPQNQKKIPLLVQKKAIMVRFLLYLALECMSFRNISRNRTCKKLLTARREPTQVACPFQLPHFMGLTQFARSNSLSGLLQYSAWMVSFNHLLAVCA